MSFIKYCMRCNECSKEWNTFFSMIGSDMTAGLHVCPRCKSDNTQKIADDWNTPGTYLDWSAK